MKTDYIARAEKFITEFYPYIKGLRSNSDIDWAVFTYNCEHHRKVHYAHGVARRAFITSDYVIKMNYGSGHHWAGGCEEEYNFYNDTIAHDGYSYLFAPIHKFTYQRKTFYIMPRINGIGSGKYWDKLTDEELAYIRNHVIDMHRGNYGHYNRKPVIVDYAMIRA